MGRYYRTDNFQGKFGFAIQSSDDPEIFGMFEDNHSIHYYLDADEEKIENCKKVIDKQYNTIGIPPEERIYEVDTEYTELDKLDEKYYNDEEDPKKRLAWCRLFLGCAIYTELVNLGYCELEAEL